MEFLYYSLLYINSTSSCALITRMVFNIFILGEDLMKLEKEKGIIIRFVIGHR